MTPLELLNKLTAEVTKELNEAEVADEYGDRLAALAKAKLLVRGYELLSEDYLTVVSERVGDVVDTSKATGVTKEELEEAAEPR